MASLLELENVTKVYSRGLLHKTSNTALNNVSLTLNDDEPTILTVAGESGSGKTTLAMLLLGFITATEGVIRYKGEDISKLQGEAKLTFRREVQAVFQDPFAVFNPFYTVDHLLAVPIERFKLAKTKTEARDKMEEALTAVGLRPEDILGRFPHQLSGGQRQRINVARALLLKPRILVADEPVSMLDVSIQAGVLELLDDLSRRLGLAVLYISHDIATVGYICDRVAVMYLGKVVEEGPVQRVLRRPMHPYTQRLMAAIPSVDPAHRRERVELEGDVPTPLAVPRGCRFAPRCPHATQMCRDREPDLAMQEPGHAVRCHLSAAAPAGA
jgi:peptide/nickel transport system ATP-binding protein